MQRILQKIKDARTADQLVKAVDEMHDDEECEKFRTVAAREAVVSKRQLVTNNSSSYAVARWFMFCAMVAAGQKVCTVKGVYNTLMDHCWTNATTHNTRYYVVSAFTNITISLNESRELWVSQGPAPAEALIQVFDEEKDPNRIRWITNGINNLARMTEKGGQKFFNTKKCYDAYMKSFVRESLTEECVQWIAASLASILTDNKEGRELFGTEEFLDSYSKMEKYSQSDLDASAAFDKTLGMLEECVAGEEDTSNLDPIQKIQAAKDTRGLARALINFHDNKQESFRVGSTLDYILEKKDLLTSNAAAFALGQAITWFAMIETGQLLAATPEMCDLIMVRAYNAATDHETRYWLVSAGPGNICISDFEARKVFAQPFVAKGCLEVLGDEVVSERIRWLANAIYNIAHPLEGAKLFCSEQAVEAFTAAIAHTKTAESAEWVLNALNHILVPSNDTAKQFFGTPQFRDAVKKLREFAYNAGTSGKAAYDKVFGIVEQEAKNNDTAIRNLRLATNASEVTDALLYLHDKAGEEHRTAAVRDLVLVEHRGLVAEADERLIFCFAKFLTWFSQKSEGRKLLLLARQDIYSFIADELLTRTGTSRDARYWCLSCVGNLLYSGSEAKTLFSTPEIADSLLSLLSSETDPHRARWLCTAIALLCSEERGRNLFTATTESLEKTIQSFISAIPYATTPDSTEWVAGALLNLTLNNKAAVELIANQEFRNVYSAMQRYATTKESKQDYERLLNLLDGEIRRKKVQSLLDLASRYGRTIPAEAVDILVENEVDPSSLLILNQEALEEIGIGVVARIVLMDIITKEKQQVGETGAASPSSTLATAGGVSPSYSNLVTPSTISPRGGGFSGASAAAASFTTQQLEQERQAHIKTCQERTELEVKLKEKESENEDLKREVGALKQQQQVPSNEKLVLTLPFLKEKMFYGFNNSNNSENSIQNLARYFMKKNGSYVSSTSKTLSILNTRPVAGFSFEKVTVLADSSSTRQSFENSLTSSSGNTKAFFSGENNTSIQNTNLLLLLRDQFLPTTSQSKNAKNLFFTFFSVSGISNEKDLLSKLSSSSSKIETTVSLELAARIGSGEFDNNNAASSSMIPILWCVAAVENAKPVLPENVAASSENFDCTCAGLNHDKEIVGEGVEYLQVSFDDKNKNLILPLGVLWVKAF